LAQHDEDAIEPDIPIIDPHHHLWVMGAFRYMLPEYLSDIRSGHNVQASIYMEAWTGYRKDGPEELRCIGETEFAYEQCVKSNGLVAAGIVAYANLRAPDYLDRVLDAHVEASHSRLCGVRDIATWDSDRNIRDPRFEIPQNILDLPEFRRSVRRVGERDLVCDLAVYFHQLGKLAEVARDAPNTKIVLNHVGMPLGLGRYEGRYSEVFREWEKGISTLCKCPNVYVKLGGLGMRWMGFGFHMHEKPPSSETLAEAWSPHIQTTIDLFGPARCLFESNFPVDAEICSYVTLWNAYKRISADYSAQERADLFCNTALDVYKLKVPSRIASGTVQSPLHL
jgi:predicted TIM-barrel fold metal-dependent hydrolase